MTSLEQHQLEIEANLRSWNDKPLLQQIYADFYTMIVEHIDQSIPGQIVELGSGIGNLRAHVPSAICTDLFPNPWLDMACDAYRLPFADGTVSHLVMFDVFHHLERPNAFFREARRVLAENGRLILFEPYMSIASYPIYGLLHHEPVAIRQAIDTSDEPPTAQTYYAAQGNATRLFFSRARFAPPIGFVVHEVLAFSSFAYLLSGGYSKRPFYPKTAYPTLTKVDRAMSKAPRLFGGRCLIDLRPSSTPGRPGAARPPH